LGIATLYLVKKEKWNSLTTIAFFLAIAHISFVYGPIILLYF